MFFPQCVFPDDLLEYFLCKRFPTVGAMIGFLPSVYFLVFYQINFQSQRLLTVGALICFSPVCVLWWSTRVFICAKDFPQWVHWYGFSPVCIFWCFTRVTFKSKDFSQWVHWNGFSSVSLNNILDYLNSQKILQWFYFEIVCFKCINEKTLHWLNWYSFSPLCVYNWNIRWLGNWKDW